MEGTSLNILQTDNLSEMVKFLERYTLTKLPHNSSSLSSIQEIELVAKTFQERKS